MFAAKGDYTESRLDRRPATTREGKKPSLELLLVNGINHPSMDTCTENPISALSSDLHAPDSSVSCDEDNDRFQTYIKSDSEAKTNYVEDDVDEHSDPVPNLSSAEDGPFEQEDLYPQNIECDETHNDELRSSSNDSSKPIEATSIIHTVPKFTQNFTLNVSPGVGNIAALQNVVQSVSSGNQTLWLPTIITSGASASNDDQAYHGEMEGPSTTLSQIILTGSGQHFMSNPLLSGSNSCHVTSNHKYSPKVQILSSITIPKHGAITSSMKGVIHANYLNQNDNKHNTPKQLLNKSVLNSQLSSKGPVMGVLNSGRVQSGQSQTKGSAFIPGGLKNPAGTNNKPAKFNNSPNSKMGSNAISGPNQPSHVLSRVVPGPKMSLQSVGRGLKTNNSFHYGHKVSGRSGLFTNVVQAQNIQPVKIIQQQNLPTNNKGGLKTIPPSRTGIGTKGLMNSLQGKSWSSAPANQVGDQKQNTFTKNVSGVVNIQRSNDKNASQRLVQVQQAPCQMVPNSSHGNRTNPQYFQPSDDTDNTVRYIQSYLGLENNQTNVSSNQNLTAQILQSLSQPKSLNVSSHQVLPTSGGNVQHQIRDNDHQSADSFEQWRQIHGDPTTLLMSDDILGTEERPNLSDDSLSYHYYTLQLVMLDHTYAGTPQAATNTTSSSTIQVTNNTSPVNNNSVISSPISSPLKTNPSSLSSPIHCALPSQSPLHTMAAALPSANSGTSQSAYQYGSVAPQDDDDAASVISSIDGDNERRPTDRNGSDTETAPEGEEEGKTRCVCDFTHDDGYMICCDRCGEWQHVDCMAIDRQNIPDDYMCERCQPRLVDRKRARSIQMRKREELTGLGSSGSESSGGSLNINGNKRPAPGGPILIGHKKRPLTVTTYSNTVGGISRAVPMIASHQPPPYTLPAAVASIPNNNIKRGPKRPRRVDNGRKGPKRKIPEKRMKRKGEIAKYRTKYSSPPNCSQQLHQWSESYELAMTNHYSPELRAKIARYYTNKTANSASVMSVVLTAHHCTTVPHAGGKILIATKDMKENSPIIELRGKYMLSTQHRPSPHPTGRAGSQRPGPYLFFYRFPKDSTQVCIDTRTYGNEARFVRRSCKPNAELQHCIIKGALHVYLVTISCVQSNTEISIRHESSGSWQPCACGNPKHCKQTLPGTALTHRNNGTSSDGSVRERRGRTRHASSSSHFSPLPSSAPLITPKENISPKEVLSPSPKVDRRRRSEPESVFNHFVKQDKEEKFTPDQVQAIKQEVPALEPKVELLVDVKPDAKPDAKLVEPELTVPIKEEVVFLPDVDITKFIKEEVEPEISNEKIKEIIHPELSPVKIEIIPKAVDKIEKIEEEPERDVVPVGSEEITTLTSIPTPVVVDTVADSLCELQSDEKSVESLVSTRRISTHSTRTTRATSCSTVPANESADEKSDSQCESKVQSAKDKKKMTREERKMEAIMKAFERMEKAEQRKLENRDKQSKRRESDPQQSCSVTSTSESKDIQPEHGEEHIQQSMLKGRRRRKGRVRTTSQNQQNSRNRLNSVDSDMVTSEDEHTSLMSPPRSSSMSVAEHFTDITPLTSEEAHSYRELAETNLALGESINRMKVGLSSACLLVEAAVGPLETTFKFPKTKKAIMNEWLNKSPEPNLSYDIGSQLDYSNHTDNNNSTHPFMEKRTFLGGKSIENLVRAANTMIGSLSGGVISADSTPEKQCGSEQSDPENLSATGATADSSCSPSPAQSPQSYSQKAIKRVVRDLSRDPVAFAQEKNRTPKKMRKGAKICTDLTPIKRSLRSSAVSTSSGCRAEEAAGDHTSPPAPLLSTVLPPPPQHSAKKRWLRQAISEESDSPTAESPPNEMVTPLKKRRLARESLSLEAASFGHCDDAQCPPLLGTPTKDVCNEISFRQHSTMLFPSFEKPPIEDNVHINYHQDTACKSVDKNNSVSSSDFSSEKVLSIPTLEDTTAERNVENVNNNEESSYIYEDSKTLEIKKNAFLCNEVKSQISLLEINTVEEINPTENDFLESKCEIITEETNTNDRVDFESAVGESKSESASNIHSTETSGNSSPVLDEMDDIQKKIHSFHTENIQILKIRNKKQPKEKRKKVNLNFDLSVLDDQTVEVKLKIDKESLQELKSDTKIENCHDAMTEVLQNVNSVTPDNSNPEAGADHDDATIVQVLTASPDNMISSEDLLTEALCQSQKGNTNFPEIINNNFPSTNLFSESFRTKPFTVDLLNPLEASATIPDINVIKNAIDMTTSLETSVFKDGTVLNSADEYKNVQEILSRVNQMDSRNSVLLSGVLKDTNHSVTNEMTSPTKLFLGRSNDPRLNPPPAEKPKPVRRKLSISEYRRRHSMANPSEGGSPPSTPGEGTEGVDGEEEDMSRLEKNLEESIDNLDPLPNMSIGVFNAQPTMLERQREKLSERLRREFGLTFPEDEEVRAPALADECGTADEVSSGDHTTTPGKGTLLSDSLRCEHRNSTDGALSDSFPFISSTNNPPVVELSQLNDV